MTFFRGTKQFKRSTILIFSKDNLLRQSSLRISTVWAKTLAAYIISSKLEKPSKAVFASQNTSLLSDTANGFSF